jgi:MscS family membrane protein
VVNASVETPIIVTIAWVAVRLTDGLIGACVLSYVEQTESRLDDELVPIVSRVTNIAIVSIAGVVILDSLGYDVTAVIASFGVVGVAVGFASRKTMADAFGGAHILSAKPFLVGDTVDIEGTTGTVEETGLRTTRTRDFDGRAVTLSNSTTADAEVRTISSEPTRRVKTLLGLSYDTTPTEMDRAIDLTVDGVDTNTGAWFWNYGDSTLQVRLEYHIDALGRWKEVRDTVNREIQAAFDDAGFDMAFPTRTVRLESNGEDDEPVGRSQNLEQMYRLLGFARTVTGGACHAPAILSDAPEYALPSLLGSEVSERFEPVARVGVGRVTPRTPYPGVRHRVEGPVDPVPVSRGHRTRRAGVGHVDRPGGLTPRVGLVHTGVGVLVDRATRPEKRRGVVDGRLVPLPEVTGHRLFRGDHRLPGETGPPAAAGRVDHVPEGGQGGRRLDALACLLAGVFHDERDV